MLAFVLVFNEKHCSENILRYVALCIVMRFFFPLSITENQVFHKLKAQNDFEFLTF